MTNHDKVPHLLEEVDRYCQSHGLPMVRDSEDYYYRFETRNGWQRYFNSTFEISERKGNTWDLSFTPQLESNSEQSGSTKAFYCYEEVLANGGDRLRSVEYQASNRVSALPPRGYYEVQNLYEICLLARYKKSTPALSVGSTKTVDQSHSNCCVILPSPEFLAIPDSDIDVLFAGFWLPKSPSTGELIQRVIEALTDAEEVRRGFPELVDLEQVKGLLSVEALVGSCRI